MGIYKRLYFNIWNSCNLHCSQCFNDGGSTGGKVLTKNEIIRIAVRAKDEWGIEEIQLTGGEPTGRPDLPELLDALIEQGLYVWLQTNGVFDELFRNRILLYPSDKLGLIISLDGFKTNDYFRGKENTAKTLANIQVLAPCFPLRVNCLLSEQITWKEIEDLVEMATQHHFSIAFNPVIPDGRADRSILMPRDRYFEWMFRIGALKQGEVLIRSGFDTEGSQLVEYENCPVRHMKAIHINADGKVHTCGFFTGNPFMYAGSVKDISLKDIARNLSQLEGPELALRCKSCDYYRNALCHGGCPARIFALHGRFDREDYYCMADYYQGKSI